MKNLILSALSLLLFTSPLAATEPFTIIPDLSSLPLLNPDLKERKTLKLVLQNGVQALIISDPSTDQSAASVTVDAGSWDDPLEFPGMAHFCEHMLFMGTKTYPDENDFFSLMANYGGTTNAMTTSSQTIYMFSSQENGFLPLLDRFAHFFIDPLFNPAQIAREMHAVDQEFSKSLEHDGWRTAMVLKETGNPNHPHRMFSCGNSATLSHIPQEALLKWHSEHYGAKQIHVAIYSSLGMDTLVQNVVDAFGPILEIKPPARIDPKIRITSAEQKGHVTYIEPIQKKQSLLLLWELPLELSEDKNQSIDLIAYALKRGQKNSLYETLKQEGMIDYLTVDVDTIGNVQHRFLEISLELTDLGCAQVDTVIQRVYQALALFRQTGIPHYLFQERNAAAKLNYQYQSRQDAFSFIMQIGETISHEPLSTYPRAQLIGEHYDQATLEKALAFLTPENSLVFFMAPEKTTQVSLDRKEKWMGVNYTVKPISTDWIKLWTKAEPHSNIRMAPPNPFLPSRIDLVQDVFSETTPLLISSQSLGKAYYARCPEYGTAEASLRVHILSPLFNREKKSQVLMELYCDHLTDLLHPTLSAASQAGFSVSIFPDHFKLNLRIDGFSDKCSELLQEILRQMPLTPPSEEQFTLYYQRAKKDYSNSQKELPYRQGKDLLDSVIVQNRASKVEKLEILSSLTYEDLLEFHQKFFKSTYTEAFLGGNLSLKDAESIWIDIIHALGKTPYPNTDHPKVYVAQLPEHPLSITQMTEAQGNAALLLIDEGNFSFQGRSMQDILGPVIKEAFFNELRTKQKTGYIAISDSTDLEGRLYQYLIVQSNSHQPEDLLYRFELFLEEFLQSFQETIPPSRFEILQQSAILSLENRYRNLKEKINLWDLLAFQYDGDFLFIPKRIENLKTLSYETFCSLCQKHLSRNNRQRLAILMQGQLKAPFSYASTTALKFSEISSYFPRNTELHLEHTADSSMR